MDPLNKMSKSKGDSAIFIHDAPEDISRKIRSAFCPERTVEGNPILQIFRNVIFNFYNDGRIQIGNKEAYGSYKDLEHDFIEGRIHPSDLKESLSSKITEILEPSKKYFQADERRRELMEEFK